MDETKQTRLVGKVRHVTHIARATGSNLATGDVFGSVPAQFAHRPEKAGLGVFIGKSCLKCQFPFGSRDMRLEDVISIIISFRPKDALAGFIDEFDDAVLPFPKAKGGSAQFLGLDFTRLVRHLKDGGDDVGSRGALGQRRRHPCLVVGIVAFTGGVHVVRKESGRPVLGSRGGPTIKPGGLHGVTSIHGIEPEKPKSLLHIVARRPDRARPCGGGEHGRTHEREQSFSGCLEGSAIISASMVAQGLDPRKVCG